MKIPNQNTRAEKQETEAAEAETKTAATTKNPRRRKSRPSRDEAAAPLGTDFPHWIPTDSSWDKFPESIREAVPRILAPAYRRFVLDAPGELERSVGLTLVHLTWLELCGQIQMAVASANPDSLDAILQSPEDMLDRHLRLATVKCQTAELLMKLRIVESALQRPPAAPPPALPPPDTIRTSAPLDHPDYLISRL